MTDFGEKLKKLRHEAGLTQKQLADRLRISKSTVSFYEQSIRYPSLDVLIDIARVFHISLEYLLGETDKSRFLDISDLPAEDVRYLSYTIDFLRKKNGEDDCLRRTETNKC